MDEVTHEIFDALRAVGSGHSSQVQTYRLWRELANGQTQRLTIRFLDAGGRVSEGGLRYHAEIEREDGQVLAGSPADTPARAINLLPWDELL